MILRFRHRCTAKVLHQSGTSLLLGREEELDVPLRRREHANQEEGRVLLVIGEPGLGQSKPIRGRRSGSNQSAIGPSHTTALPITGTSDHRRLCERPVLNAMTVLRRNSTSSKPCLCNRVEPVRRICRCSQRSSQSRPGPLSAAEPHASASEGTHLGGLAVGREPCRRRTAPDRKPNLVPVRLSSSRRYHKSGIDGLPSKLRSCPLIRS